MASFYYKAVNAENKTLEGTVQADSLASARGILIKQSLRPILVRQNKTSVKSLLSFKSKKIKSKDMVVFTRQLATMVGAGVPLLRSLNTLQSQTENKNLKQVVGKLSKSIEGGSTFAEALAASPEVFSNIYVNMVMAGEAAGILDNILDKLALQQEKDATIRTKFKSAMTYPMVLIGITILTFIGLMTFVVPRLAKIISDLGTEGSEVPTLTQIMLSVSNFMITKWYILVLALFITVYYLRKYLKKPSGQYMRDKLLLKTPIIKVVITKIAVARFARIFASLMSAGVTVLDSIEITGKALGNKIIEKELLTASKTVASGQTLSESLASSDIFPPIISQMLAIGEETGKIDTILVKVADFYEAEVDATIDSIGSIIEPLMILVMGAMVGLIAASVLGPISNLANQIA